jgi:hypothetical protein
MQYIENKMRANPELKDEDILAMYPEAKQSNIDEFRKNIGEANEPSRKSIFGSTKTDD